MKHRIEYALVRLLIAIVRVMPDGLVRASGTLLGLGFYTVDRAHRRIAQRNLAAAFPGRSDEDRRAIARAAFAFRPSAVPVAGLQHVVAGADARARGV